MKNFARLVKSTEAMAAALVDAEWCRSCQYNQRGLCLYCRNDGADNTMAEACTRRAAEWLQEEAK
jgi:hypothetical protein